jgi:hypothetical protein
MTTRVKQKIPAAQFKLKGQTWKVSIRPQNWASTDLHTQADRRYSIRLDGKLERIAPDQFPVPNNDQIVKMLRQAYSISKWTCMASRLRQAAS